MSSPGLMVTDKNVPPVSDERLTVTHSGGMTVKPFNRVKEQHLQRASPILTVKRVSTSFMSWRLCYVDTGNAKDLIRHANQLCFKQL